MAKRVISRPRAIEVLQLINTNVTNFKKDRSKELKIETNL